MTRDWVEGFQNTIKEAHASLHILMSFLAHVKQLRGILRVLDEKLCLSAATRQSKWITMRAAAKYSELMTPAKDCVATLPTRAAT